MNDESPIDTEMTDVEPVQEQVETTEADTPSRSTRDALSKALDGINFKDDDDKDDSESVPTEKKAEKASTTDTGGGESPEGRGDTTAELPAPNRFNKAAKAAWDNADPVIKSEFTRAIQELETGLTQKAEKLKPIEHFLTLAEQQKVDPAQALQGYVAIEQLLYKDPREGFTQLGQKMGLSVPQMIQLLGGAPQGAGKQTAQQQPDQRDQQIVLLQQELSAIRNEFKSVNTIVQEQALAQTQSALEQFAKDHPRLDELTDEIVRQVEAGFDLQQAYDRAARLNPAPEDTAIQVAAHTRTRKSVTGTSKGGSNPTTMTSKSSREALERAFSQLGQ